MVQLEEKIYFYLLLALPLLGLVFVLFLLWQQRRRRLFAHSELLHQLAPERSRFKLWFRFFLMCSILTMLVVALVNPRSGTKMETVKREGIDLVFAIDVSKSMLAQDVSPNRLKKTQHLINELIKQLQGDRIGIVAYAGQAFPQLPLTTDYSAAKMFLQSLNTDMISSQGTAIQEALSMAASYFDMKQNTTKVILLFSDGEDHEMGASEIADEIAKKGIRVFTFGVGTEKGAPIPTGEANTSYKRDKDGEVVISHLNPQLLKDIAQSANGSYFSTENTQKSVKTMIDLIQKMQKTEFETQKIIDFDDHFQWFLAAALLLLLLDGEISYKKTSWVKRLNLFNENKNSHQLK